MNKLRVVCDLDNIIINLMDPWLSWYNETWKDNKTLEDLKVYSAHEWELKEGCGDRIFEFFEDMERYRNLPPLPGAVEGLKEIHNAGHEIIISTAVAGESASAKFFWCRKYLPFVPMNHIMVGGRKDVIKGDILIDDAPKNLTAYQKAWPTAKLFSIEYPFNLHLMEEVHLMAKCYRNTQAAWESIVYHCDLVSQLERA